jgi:CDP-glycerol glycerophosphotransferase
VDRYYREEYRYDGEILAAGFPRNDGLLAPDAEQVRASTRARLGIGSKQTVVLYAPTWRDNLATNYRAAEMLDLLDVEATALALGPDYVIAVRGHRFHVHGVKSRGTARVVDVTDHPEINDLILACDAAVLDYSSLRFDVAVVGRPMVFLVPDLHEYTAITRGFLYDFAESAPGPLVRTGAEVVTALRDLEGLRSSYAEEYVAFNERFNRLNDGHAAERVVDRLLG